MNHARLKNRIGFVFAVVATVVVGTCGAAPPVSVSGDEARAALAPTGKLRLAFPPNPLFVNKDVATGEMRGGLAFEVGRALAERLGVPFEPIAYGSISKLIDSVQAGGWDITMIAIDPTRENAFDFTAPFVVVDNTYLVPGDSPIRTVADADRPGARIAVPQKSKYDLDLTRLLGHAELVRCENAPATFELLKTGQVQAMAGNREGLLNYSKKLTGSRLLEDRFGDDQIALALPKGGAAGLSYAREFVREAVASGEARQWIQRAGLTAVRVAGDTGAARR